MVITIQIGWDEQDYEKMSRCVLPLNGPAGSKLFAQRGMHYSGL